jgi:hypothetical protein
LFCFCFVFCFFVNRCLSFCTFSCCQSIVCPFAIYDFQLFLSYLQTFLTCNHIFFIVILKNTCEIVMQNDKIIALCWISYMKKSDYFYQYMIPTLPITITIYNTRITLFNAIIPIYNGTIPIHNTTKSPYKTGFALVA